MSRVYRTVTCAGECGGKPKTLFKDDVCRSEYCSLCLEVISYEKQENIKPTKKIAIKKEEVKTVKSISEVNIIQRGNKESKVEVGRIYCEKWQQTVDSMPDKFVDYTFTSPPYNVGVGIDGNKYQDFKDSSSQQGYFEEQCELINSLLRITKNHIFYNNQMLTNNRNALITLMYQFQHKLKEILIWNKKQVAPASTAGVTNSKFELILVFSNDRPDYRVFQDANFHGTFNNVVELKGHDKNEFASVNKAVFPLPLVKTFMDAFGGEGDIWYDPFGGTGTVAVAAIDRKKNWIISEMSKNQCTKVTAPRIRAAMKQGKLELV